MDFSRKLFKEEILSCKNIKSKYGHHRNPWYAGMVDTALNHVDYLEESRRKLHLRYFNMRLLADIRYKHNYERRVPDKNLLPREIKERGWTAAFNGHIEPQENVGVGLREIKAYRGPGRKWPRKPESAGGNSPPQLSATMQTVQRMVKSADPKSNSIKARVNSFPSNKLSYEQIEEEENYFDVLCEYKRNCYAVERLFDPRNRKMETDEVVKARHGIGEDSSKFNTKMVCNCPACQCKKNAEVIDSTSKWLNLSALPTSSDQVMSVVDTFVGENNLTNGPNTYYTIDTKSGCVIARQLLPNQVVNIGVNGKPRNLGWNDFDIIIPDRELTHAYKTEPIVPLCHEDNEKTPGVKIIEASGKARPETVKGEILDCFKPHRIAYYEQHKVREKKGPIDDNTAFKLTREARGYMERAERYHNRRAIVNINRRQQSGNRLSTMGISYEDLMNELNERQNQVKLENSEKLPLTTPMPSPTRAEATATGGGGGGLLDQSSKQSHLSPGRLLSQSSPRGHRDYEINSPSSQAIGQEDARSQLIVLSASALAKQSASSTIPSSKSPQMNSNHHLPSRSNNSTSIGLHKSNSHLQAQAPPLSASASATTTTASPLAAPSALDANIQKEYIKLNIRLDDFNNHHAGLNSGGVGGGLQSGRSTVSSSTTRKMLNTRMSPFQSMPLTYSMLHQHGQQQNQQQQHQQKWDGSIDGFAIPPNSPISHHQIHSASTTSGGGVDRITITSKAMNVDVDAKHSGQMQDAIIEQYLAS